MRRAQIFGVICALNMSATAAADPMSATDPGPTGAVVSTLRGPIGFAQPTRAEPPVLHVHEISVQADLHPSVALVTLTYTLENRGDKSTTTVGVTQRSHTFEDGRRLKTARPLGAVAWLDDTKLAEGAVRVHALPGDSAHDPGYELGVTVTLPHGVSELSIALAIQTVRDVRNGVVRRPATTGDAYFALQFSHFAWDWAPDRVETAGPERPNTRVVVATAGGVPLDAVEAESWTRGALTDGSAYFWNEAPWIALRYQAPSTVARPETHDSLVRRARQLLSTPPPGHVTLPEGAEPVVAPRAPVERVVAAERARRVAAPASAGARRALIVPMSAFVLLLLLGYLYVRRRLN